MTSVLSDPLTSASRTATTTTEPRDKGRRRAVLTPGGADVVFNDEAASAKAGQATVPKLVPWWHERTRPTPYLDLSLPAYASAALKGKAARKDYVPIKRTTQVVLRRPQPDQAGWQLAHDVQRFGENIDRRVWDVQHNSGPRRNLDCEGRRLNLYQCRQVSLAMSRAQQTHSRQQARLRLG